jgi:hypothetical protein
MRNPSRPPGGSVWSGEPDLEKTAWSGLKSSETDEASDIATMAGSLSTGWRGADSGLMMIDGFGVMSRIICSAARILSLVGSSSGLVFSSARSCSLLPCMKFFSTS